MKTLRSVLFVMLMMVFIQGFVGLQADEFAKTHRLGETSRTFMKFKDSKGTSSQNIALATKTALPIGSLQSTSNDIETLVTAINELTSSVQGDFGIAYINLQNPKDTLFINADEMFHAASTMKTPVMIEAYKQALAGGFSIQDSMLVYNEFKSIADGSPFSVEASRDRQAMHDLIGSKTTIREVIYEMTINSGNLATNILIDRLGAENVNATMRELGAMNIQVLRGVEDMKAFEAGLSNRTTARDLAIIFEHIANGTAVSEEASADMISILLDQHFREMIPAGLPDDVKVAHKTGTITGINHDSGIVMLPDGRKYVLVILSKNLSQNSNGLDIGSKISELIYDWFLTN
jgi:beta-lactamase class A